MKVSDIIGLDAEALSKMSEAELKKALNTLVSTANKRIKRIEKTGLGKASITLNLRRRGSGKVRPFSSKLPKSKYYKRYKTEVYRAMQEAKRRERILNMISELKSFLGAKGSSVEGVKEIASKIIEDMGVFTDYESLSDKQKGRFWDAYHLAQKRYPALFDRRATGYEKLRETFFNLMVKYRRRTGKIVLRGDVESLAEDIKDIIVGATGIEVEESPLEMGEREDDSTTKDRRKKRKHKDETLGAEKWLFETIKVYD